MRSGALAVATRRGSGLEFGVWGLGFGFRVWGLGFRVWVFGT